MLTVRRKWTARADARGEALEGTRTIHTLVIDWVVLWIRRRRHGQWFPRFEWFAADYPPSTRVDELRLLWYSWTITAVACMVATIVLTGPIWWVFGTRAGQIAGFPGWVACGSCFAGVPYVWWRLWYARRATWRAAKYGSDDPRVRHFMLRAVPGNDSIPWQVIAGVIVMWQFAPWN